MPRATQIVLKLRLEEVPAVLVAARGVVLCWRLRVYYLETLRTCKGGAEEEMAQYKEETEKNTER